MKLLPNCLAAEVLTWSLLACGLLFVCGPGCGGKPAGESAAIQQTSAEQVSGKQLWEETLNVYSTARSYRDEAVLYLSYRLHGQLIQEPQPWGVKWTREQKLAANLFNTQLRADGERLGCYVFDIETGNLDNQWLVLEQAGELPLETLFADGLARYFAGGFAEIPLDETPSAALKAMTPPTLGWLTGQLTWAWLAQPRLVERMKDALVDERPCYHLQIHGEQLTCEVWIDQETRLVRQMTLPLELLDPAIRSAIELTEVQFFARLHQAELNSEALVAEFAVTPPRAATPVQQFVALPEPFPCAEIGKPLPNLRLADVGGRFVDLTRAGETLVLVWISGMLGQEQLTELKTAMTELGPAPIRWIAVFSDEQAVASPDGSRQLYPELRQWVIDNQLACEWLYDAQMAGSQALRLEVAPAAVIVDAQGQVQYAVGLQSDRWGERLRGALQRVLQGDSIAAEMLGDYQAYLSRYKRRLQLVGAQKLLGSAARRTAMETSAVPAPLGEAIFSKELKRPGNLYRLVVGDRTEILAFDGWQTLARLDPQGNVLERLKLPIPDGVAVTSLRTDCDASGARVYALWSLQGKDIFLLDESWNLLAQLNQRVDGNRDRVLDCQIKRGADGKLSVWVAFQNSGLQAYQLESQTWTELAKEAYDAIAVAPDSWWGIRDDLLWKSAGNQPPQPMGAADALCSRVVRSPGKEENEILVAGVSADGIWELSRWSADATENKFALLGPQLFEQSLDPVAVLSRPERGEVIAWADSLNRVHLFDDRLQSLGVWNSTEPIQGLALSEVDGDWVLLVSAGGVIKAVRGR